ncbi:MAG: EAL domain-containing protein [Thiotrichaceae bacterium]|nr:EAL domain-containing protein [Thiotrichaceae bacterium]
MKNSLTILTIIFITMVAQSAFAAIDTQQIANTLIKNISAHFYPVVLLFFVFLSALGYFLYRSHFSKKSQRQENNKQSVELGSYLLRINKKMIIKSANDKVNSLTGLSSDSIVGRSLKDIIELQGATPVDQQSILKMVKQQFSIADFGLNYRDVSLNKKTEPSLFHVSTAPVMNDRGKIIAVTLIIKDLSVRQKMWDKLLGKAEQDHLTGLINRMGYDKYIEQFPHNMQENSTHVLCFMDLDNFKPVNDSAGHAAGDELLKQLSDIFRQHVRSTDLLARTGGDEFVILFSNCTMEKAKARCENIINSVSLLRFSWADKSFIVGVSIGAVEFNSDVTVAGLQGLCKIADDACYTAKKKGRNQLFVHESGKLPELKNAQFSTDNWQDIIRNAIDNNQFKLMAQPIVPLGSKNKDNRKRYEVFIRLPYNGRILRPGSFFPAAERYGFSLEIDRWVIHEVFKQLSFLNLNTLNTGFREFTINITTASLLDDSFSSFVSEALDTFGLSASSICFEIPESIVISNFSQARKLLSRLATLGCKNSLDDFGSGLSSLSYIRDLPLHYLKIDGIFVKNIESNQVDAAMIHSLNHMSSVMNLKTVAESVENKHTAKLLHRLGVNYAQGYYCGRPQPLEELGRVSSKVNVKELKSNA